MLEGNVYVSNKNESAVVVGYLSAKKVVVMFLYPSHGFKVIEAKSLRRGEFVSLYQKGVADVGYIGEGVFDTKSYGGLIYKTWAGMINRCYSSRVQKSQPHYKGCSVHPDWHNFQVFAKWYVNHKFFNMGYELDKDLLCSGNREYSPSSCTLIPRHLNRSITSFFKRKGEMPIGVVLENGKYRARLVMSGRRKELGTFSNIVDAVNAYNKFKGREICDLAERYKGSICEDSYKELLKIGKNIMDKKEAIYEQ